MGKREIGSGTRKTSRAQDTSKAFKRALAAVEALGAKAAAAKAREKNSHGLEPSDPK